MDYHPLLLCFAVFDILHDIAHLAVQNPAKHLDGMGADAFVSLQPGDLPGTDVIFFYKRVLRDSFLLQHIPQIIIRNHFIQASLSYLNVIRNRYIIGLTNIG